MIPALDEAESIALVLDDLPWERLSDVVVADNGSTDDTAAIAAAHGARVVAANPRGYGSACLAALAALEPVDIVVFMDADHSDHADELESLLEPILDGTVDFVIGSRALGVAERGAMLPQQRAGNVIATSLIRLAFGQVYTDLGPFRAITREALDKIAMRDTTYGWTVEMQVRALQEGIRVAEVPVAYRKRVGRSKIAGTVKGTVLAGWKIITTILVLRLRHGPAVSRS